MGLDASLDPSFKTERKATLKVFRTFKKLKYMDDPKLAEKAHLTTLRDEWLIAFRKPMLKTKLWIKKTVEAEKKKDQEEE